jgi:hypothetical protein
MTVDSFITGSFVTGWAAVEDTAAWSCEDASPDESSIAVVGGVAANDRGSLEAPLEQAETAGTTATAMTAKRAFLSLCSVFMSTF